MEQISPRSSICGEVEATWCAIQRAAAKGFNRIIIEGDAWNVIVFAKIRLIWSQSYS